MNLVLSWRFRLQIFLIGVAYQRGVGSSEEMLLVNKMPPVAFLCLYETTCVLQIDDIFTHEIEFLILGAWCAIKSGPPNLYQG